LTTAGDDFEACFDARDRDEVEDVSGKRLWLLDDIDFGKAEKWENGEVQDPEDLS
jgi:hypothetical protein